MWWLAVSAQAGSDTWTLDDAAFWIDGEATVSSPASTWLLDEGFVFPVRDAGDRVGFVFVGQGTWQVPFSEPADARATCNRLVMLEGVDPAWLVGTARNGADLALAVDRGISVGLDAWSHVEPEVQLVRERDHVLSTHLPDGTEHVLVVAHDALTRARRTAEQVLSDRTAFMRDRHVDPASLVEVDRWRRTAEPTAEVSLLGDYRTPFAWDRFAGNTDVRVSERWLSYVNDPAGIVDPATTAQVLARTEVDGQLRQRTVSRMWREVDADGMRVPAHRTDLVGAGVTVQFEAEPGLLGVIGRVVADLQLVGVGAPQSVVVIDVPHVEQERWMSNPPLQNGFVLETVGTQDGALLPYVHLPLTGDQTEGRGRVRTIAIRLTEPLLPGEVTTIRLAWRDRHRYRHVLDLWNGNLSNPLTSVWDYGSTTSLLRVVPKLRSASPAPAPVALRVGAPRVLGNGVHLVVSGAQGPSFAQGAHTWVDAHTTSVDPVVALGDWRETSEEGSLGFPAVRTLLRTQSSDLDEEVPPRVRQLLMLSRGVLPPYPGHEVDLAEMYSEEGRLRTVVAGGGVVSLHPLVQRMHVVSSEPSIRTRYPHHEVFALATGLHHQWWTERGLVSGGAGLPMAMSMAFATRVIGGTFGRDEADTWFQRLSEVATPADGQIPAPDAAWSHYALGYVLGRTLVGEVGEPAWFSAASAVLDGRFPATWEGFEAAFSVGGNDVGHVFDVWVRAGVVPTVSGKVSRADDQIRIRLASDLPYGTLQVPVRLHGAGDLRTDLIVAVHDGSGEAVVPWGDGLARLEIDPERRLLLRR